ncbi:Dihydrolipoyllysine-residue succinyltransferase component of 2-oxoglutarate dehydrogenase complex, mitochondrial [Mycena kentingensis (nom. inval.)]|nr:Dihydrolipoyllysine-residue succinyltransferase component of 2-oxoglutarate dehydrogenase complex, mitochondrial [Mycena kentingensis (nom. inval.)]
MFSRRARLCGSLVAMGFPPPRTRVLNRGASLATRSLLDIIKVPEGTQSMRGETLQQQVGDGVSADGGLAMIETTKMLSETSKKAGEKASASSSSAPRPSATFGPRAETRVKLSPLRRTIASRLKQSQNAAASLTTFNEIDMSSIVELRSSDALLASANLGYLSVFARACALALTELPIANASIDGDDVVYHNYVDLGVTVATPSGVVTPVVRNAERMSLVEIEREIQRLGQMARNGSLALEDLSGGTFTISSGTVANSLFGQPMINLPQSAVLAMHSIKQKPVVADGQIVMRPVMVVALTYDHRLLDGREGTTFLVKVKQYIEDPMKMLL